MAKKFKKTAGPQDLPAGSPSLQEIHAHYKSGLKRKQPVQLNGVAKKAKKVTFLFLPNAIEQLKYCCFFRVGGG